MGSDIGRLSEFEQQCKNLAAEKGRRKAVEQESKEKDAKIARLEKKIEKAVASLREN